MRGIFDVCVKWFFFENPKLRKSKCLSTSDHLQQLLPDSSLSCLPAHRCQINLPKYLLITSLLCSKNPSRAAQYQQHNVHSPWPGIKSLLQSGSNFPFLLHFPLFSYNVAACVNSLLDCLGEDYILSPLLLFSQAVHCLRCSSPLWLYSEPSFTATLDHIIHHQVWLPVLQMHPSSEWNCKYHESRHIYLSSLYLSPFLA